MQTRNWDDKATGAKRYMTEIVAESMQLGPRSATPGAGTASVGGPAMDIRRPTAQSDIPVISEDELTVSGIEEEPKTIKDTDLPF